MKNMVAKIAIGRSLYGMLAYNMQKVEKREAKVLDVNKIGYPLSGEFQLNECYRDFEYSLPKEYRCNSPFIHISLNPHPDDKLTDEQLTAISREYMDRLGYGEQPYIIFKHDDMAREHIHIVSLRVNAEGRKINDSFEHRRSKEITNDIEQKYGLLPADKCKRVSPDEVHKADMQQGDVKKQLASVVRPLLKSYRLQSIGEWNALLSLYNVTTETVKGEHRGQPYTGLIYFITDDNGEKLSVPVKSSRIGRGVAYAGLNNKFLKDKEILKQKTIHTGESIAGVMRQHPDKEQFFIKLKEMGIDAVFRVNDEGRIYGATFIDHTEKAVFNGSRLGKNYSANVFQEYFNGTGANPFATEEIPGLKITEPLVNEETLIETEEIFMEQIGEGLIDLHSHGADYRELAFQRKMRLKAQQAARKGLRKR